MFNLKICFDCWPQSLYELTIEEFLYLFGSVLTKQISESVDSLFSEGIEERLAGYLALIFRIVAFVWENKQSNRPNLFVGEWFILSISS